MTIDYEIITPKETKIQVRFRLPMEFTGCTSSCDAGESKWSETTHYNHRYMFFRGLKCNAPFYVAYLGIENAWIDADKEEDITATVTHLKRMGHKDYVVEIRDIEVFTPCRLD